MARLLDKLKKSKSPEQLVLSAVEMLDQGQDEALAKRLSQIKFVLYGEEEKEPDDARLVFEQISYCIISDMHKRGQLFNLFDMQYSTKAMLMFLYASVSALLRLPQDLYKVVR